jgi:zinc transport system permease protein
MAGLAAVIGVVAVVGGLNASLYWDTPAGPSIVVVAFALFLVIGLLARLREKLVQRERA